MKKNLIITLLLLLSSHNYLLAQSSDSTGLITDDFLLDFTIPDLPAFKALGTEPSDILRPSDVQKFALSLNPFLNDGSAVLPKSFAMEVAPWKLASKNWTLEDYGSSKTKRFLYNTSFSLGTTREDSNSPATKVAFGIRTSFRSNNADIMTSTQYGNKLFSLNDSINKLKTNAETKWLAENKLAPSRITEDSVRKAFEDAFFKDKKKLLTKLKNKILAEYKEKEWNASRVDFAIALVGASSDSLAKNTKFDSFNFWMTSSIKSGKSGQFLIGGHVKVLSDVDIEGNKNEDIMYTLNARYYLGTKEFRGFAEFQLKDEDANTSGLYNMGAEFRATNKFWIVFNAGIEDIYGDGNKSRFKASVNLKYSFNQK
jgi:hypothetical protein